MENPVDYAPTPSVQVNEVQIVWIPISFGPPPYSELKLITLLDEESDEREVVVGYRRCTDVYGDQWSSAYGDKPIYGLVIAWADLPEAYLGPVR